MAQSANLNVMIKTARRAGRLLLKDFGEVENLQVSRKGPGDFVSRADRAAETLIREALVEARPTYGFLGEEGGETEGEDPTRRWIVDPLDGTTNFLHGMPHWAVSIALEHKGQVVAGVVYDAAKDELFFAEKGEGAFVNDRRIRVSARSRLSEAVFGAGLPPDGGKHLPAMLRDLGKLMPACSGMRRNGAASLDLCWVAAGRYEGFWEYGLKPWDIAAGIVIAKEAGAFVEPLVDGSDLMDDGHILCAAEPIFESVAKVLRA
ncbi:MAG: inositol monophosphatase family protein [Pseudomonadota bacterium]